MSICVNGDLRMHTSFEIFCCCCTKQVSVLLLISEFASTGMILCMPVCKASDACSASLLQDLVCNRRVRQAAM